MRIWQTPKALAPLGKKRWFVYAKRPFAGPKAVLAYLSRYAHRAAISNCRPIALNERRVTFKVNRSARSALQGHPRLGPKPWGATSAS
jgi:hypothetical protein